LANSRSALPGLLAILPLLFLVACSGDKDQAPPTSEPSSAAQSFTSNQEDAEVLDVLLKSLDAYEAEDLDAAMAALDPESRIYQPTLDHTRALFQEYDLAYRILELEVTSRTDTEAVIQFTQETRRLAGPEFRDNVVVGRHLLHKRDGVWLIYQSLPQRLTYLDEQ
jgi:hypothetical protein